MHIGIATRTPLLDRLQRDITALLVPLATDRSYVLLADIVSILIMVAILSFPLLMAVQDDSFRVGLIVILLVCMLAWGYFFTRHVSPACKRLLYGPPVFDPIGGIPRRRFFAALACSDGMSFEFSSADMTTVRAFNQIDRELTEQALKLNYRRLSGQPDAEVEARWPAVWKEQILGVRTAGIRSPHISFGEALSSKNIASRVETLKLEAVERLIGPIIKLFQVLILLLTFGFLLGWLELVAVMQIGLLFSLIISALLFIYHAHLNAEIPFCALFQGYPGDLVRPFQARIAALAKSSVRPTSVSMPNGYLAVTREYFSLLLAGGTIMSAASALMLVAVAIAIGMLTKPVLMGVLLPWYRHLGLALALIPVGMLVGHYITFLALQNLKLILAPIVVTVLSVFLPYAFDYLLTGFFDVAKMRTSLLTLGVAVTAGFFSTITARVKQTFDLGA